MTHQELQSSSWDAVREIFEESVPFHQFLKFKLKGLETGSPKLHLDMRDVFVGNFVRGNLHGGVISSLLDVIGGIVAFVDVVGRRSLRSTQERIDQFSRMGTIDIRVDYLRPGYGDKFIASAYVLRTGNKVAVTRMELHNDESLLIAVGTGAYVVGEARSTAQE